MLPMQSIELAIEEMRFARESWHAGGFLRPNPYNGGPCTTRVRAVLEEAQDLDFAIGLHEGASGGMPQVGVDRFETRGRGHIISHTMEMMLAAMSVIWAGVRPLPRLRIAFLEAGGGWIAPWLDRMDRHFDTRVQRLGAVHETERAVPAQLLDLLRAGRGLPRRARRLHRPHKILWRPTTRIGRLLPRAPR